MDGQPLGERPHACPLHLSEVGVLPLALQTTPISSQDLEGVRPSLDLGGPHAAPDHDRLELEGSGVVVAPC